MVLADFFVPETPEPANGPAWLLVLAGLALLLGLGVSAVAWRRGRLGPATVAASTLSLAAGVAFAASYRERGTVVEGASFNRSVGAPAYAGVFSAYQRGDGTPWLLGGLVLLVAAGVLGAFAARRGRP